MMAPAIYNEIDPFAAQWMRELIRAGHIAPGEVNERSIRELVASDVAGSGQRHFFAGIGVWSYALRLCGVPDSASIWTGSCPCQPFSGAGKRGNFDDARHLWPVWFNLIRECRPTIVFGEQVASPDGLAWLDAVFADLEGADYTCAAADLCAAGVGAPHIRQRLYFMAYARGERREGKRVQLQPRESRPASAEAARSSSPGELANSDSKRRETGSRLDAGITTSSRSRRLGTVVVDGNDSWWANADWLQCSDGKSRPIEPGTFPLAHGAPARVGRLRGYGNAINAEQAATFIEAALEAVEVSS